MTRVIHVSLGVPPGGADAEADFLASVIGYLPVEMPPDAPATSRRFEGVDGVQIHLSEDAAHRAPDRAHVAIAFDDDLPEVERRLTDAGHEFEVFNYPAYRLVWCRDPAGNRWELRGSPRSDAS